MKAASVPLLRLMILGACLCLLTIPLMGLDHFSESINFRVVCHSQAFLLMVGFVIMYGSILMRTQRIHDIFNQKKLKRKKNAFSNAVLYKRLGLLTFVFIVFHAIWLLTSPMDGVYKIDNDTRYITCESSQSGIFTSLSLLSTTLLLVKGMVLAYQVRGVQSNFNESKQIFLSIYNLAVMFIIGVPLSLFFKFGDFRHMFVSFCISIAVTVSLSLSLCVSSFFFFSLSI